MARTHLALLAPILTDDLKAQHQEGSVEYLFFHHPAFSELKK